MTQKKLDCHDNVLRRQANQPRLAEQRYCGIGRVRCGGGYRIMRSRLQPRRPNDISRLIDAEAA